MKNIVQIKEDEIFVPIVGIADFSGNDIRSIRDLINSQKESFLKLGVNVNSVSYKDFKSLSLSETATNFLLMLMRNTKNVVKFKLELSLQIEKYKKLTCDRNQKQLNQKNETIKQLKKDRNVYGKRRGGNMETVSFVIRDSEAEISKEAFNVLLCEEGLIGKDICEYCNRSEYFAKDRFSKWQGNTLLVHVDSALDVLEKYNVKKIVNTQQTFDF